LPRLREPYDEVDGQVAKAWILPGGLWRGRRFILPELQHDWQKLRKELQRKLAKPPRDVSEHARLLEQWEKAFLREQFYVRLAELIKAKG